MNDLNSLKNCKGLTTIVWNARSLLPKIEEVERLVEEAGPDFIGITESWLNPNIEDACINIDEYNLHRFDRTVESGKRSGGGLVWYYNSDLNCTPLPEFNFCDRHVEYCVLRLNLIRTRAIYMILVYRPPSGNVQEFLVRLEQLITKLRTTRLCEINITGDINIDLLKPRDTKVKAYNDFLKRIGLKNMINAVTHIKQQELGFSLLDHYLTTDEDLYNVTGSIPTCASDHYFVY